MHGWVSWQTVPRETGFRVHVMRKLEATRVSSVCPPVRSTDYLSAVLTVQLSSCVCCYSSISSEPNVTQIEFRF